MIDLNSFQNRLKELRKEKGWTQQELANEITEIHKGAVLKKQTISSYENGIEPSIDMLISISKTFNVTIDYLTGNSDFRNTQDEILKTKDNPPVFENNTIQKYIDLPQDMISFINKLLIDDSFIELFEQFKFFSGLTDEEIRKIYSMHSTEQRINIIGAYKLKTKLTPEAILRRDIKEILHETIEELLNHLDKLRKSK